MAAKFLLATKFLLPAIPTNIHPKQLQNPSQRQGNITVSDDFFVVAILAAIFHCVFCSRPETSCMR
jgi:hypothetical protein